MATYAGCLEEDAIKWVLLLTLLLLV